MHKTPYEELLHARKLLQQAEYAVIHYGISARTIEHNRCYVKHCILQLNSKDINHGNSHHTG